MPKAWISEITQFTEDELGVKDPSGTPLYGNRFTADYTSEAQTIRPNTLLVEVETDSRALLTTGIEEDSANRPGTVVAAGTRLRLSVAPTVQAVNPPAGGYTLRIETAT